VSAGAPVLVDARGMRCPWPALRLARAVRTGDTGTAFVLLADDPNVAGEVAALAATHGWIVSATAGRFDVWTTPRAIQSLPNPA
jgi:tRNA 2-thiouridine synthesizing protein A